MDVWIPLLSAFAGAIVGGAATVITIIVQTKSEGTRQLREQAVRLALAEHSHHLEIMKNNGGGAVMPVTMYYSYHFAALQKATKGKLTPEAILELGQKNMEMREAFQQVQPR